MKQQYTSPVIEKLDVLEDVITASALGGGDFGVKMPEDWVDLVKKL